MHRINNRSCSRLVRSSLALVIVFLAGCETIMPTDKSPLRGSMLSRTSVTEATKKLLAEKHSMVTAELPNEEVMITAINSATRTRAPGSKKSTTSSSGGEGGTTTAPATTVPEEPPAWTIVGHDWFAVFDEKSQDWIHFWQNNNPGKPPDAPEWQCWGYVWHWEYNKDLKDWSVGKACTDEGTPGYGSYSFTAR